MSKETYYRGKRDLIKGKSDLVLSHGGVDKCRKRPSIGAKETWFLAMAALISSTPIDSKKVPV